MKGIDAAVEEADDASAEVRTSLATGWAPPHR